MMESLMACLAPCLGPCFGHQSRTTELSSYDDRHTNNIRAKFKKPPKFVVTDTPIEMVSTPAAAFTALAPSFNIPPTAVVPVRAATTALMLGELGELFDKVDEMLSDPGIQYAVCGLTALVSYGFAGRGASAVSIIVPASSKDVIRPWIMAASNGKTSSSPNGFEVRMRNGTKRSVKIKWTEDQKFNKMGKTTSPISARGAKVLVLPSLLEQIASAFKKECSKGVPAQNKKVDTIAEDIFWILDYAVEHNIALEKTYLGVFLTLDFWGPFHEYMGDQTYVVMQLCTQANLPIAKALEEARRLSVVRQHDQLLAQHGAQPMGPVDIQPGPFQGMRTLGREAVPSMYTLKSKDSQSDVTGPSVGRSLTRPPQLDSKLSHHNRVSLDEGVRQNSAQIPPSRGSSKGVRPARNVHQVRASVDLVDARNERPDGWL
ncbi:hypothetical protein BKA67DRAFT_177483 [Truncatella angustata]|uniref:Uncharacterized protein n=1 Tax=Truncatella angustata TaxID=152316 RepID=A0A9P8US35_9PEZI|nr:uncharacterized protein BKA67DRAFT_177483 [Truncatella angustata]KAH6657015.1 hypothetical protein BKA67DRAFT_177483 [Truncatella angustata]